MIVNSFFYKNHTSKPLVYEKSKTLPDMQIDIKSILENGTLDQLSKVNEPRMTFGKRTPIKDLTEFDKYKNIINVFNNITRKDNKTEDTPSNVISEEVKSKDIQEITNPKEKDAA